MPRSSASKRDQDTSQGPRESAPTSRRFSCCDRYRWTLSAQGAAERTRVEGARHLRVYTSRNSFIPHAGPESLNSAYLSLKWMLEKRHTVQFFPWTLAMLENFVTTISRCRLFHFLNEFYLFINSFRFSD